MHKLNIGIIGYGYWGVNLVRNFKSVDLCKVIQVADERQERLDIVIKQYPEISTTEKFEDIVNNSKIDAVVIATPVHTHYEIAQKAIMSGKHVLLEKPMCTTIIEAEDLIRKAKMMGVKLMVDHTFLYTGAVQKIKKLIDNDEIGNVKYIDSTRINLGLFQPDINVLWDLAPHDISILNYIVDERPISVNATGVSHTGNDIENIAYLTLNYKSGLIAHFSCSWASPVKLRTYLIGGDKKMILYNDLEPSEKVKLYNTSYQHKTSDEEKRNILVDYRTGDVNIPHLENKEALLGMATDFCEMIINDTVPISNYEMGLEVVRILEAAQTSIKNNGKQVKLVTALSEDSDILRYN